MTQEILLRSLHKPRQKSFQDDVFWISDSFGFTAGRDLEQTSARILTEFLEKFAEMQWVSTEMLAEELDISPARVNHHIRNIMDSGLLYRDHRFIVLRGGSVKQAVEEMRRDANRIFDDLTLIAEEIDQQLGLKNRERV